MSAALSPTVQSLVSAHSDAVETAAAAAFLQLVHAAFPSAHLMELRASLVGDKCQPIANRIFFEGDCAAAFRLGRAAFIEKTLAAAKYPDPPEHCDAIEFSSSAKYTGRDYAELEADCIVKLPLFGLTEWAHDASAIAEDGPRLLFVAPAGGRQRLPESAAPAKLSAGDVQTSRFSADHYPTGAAAYVLAEVYAPLGDRAARQQAQKLLQAERLLQFLVAKQGAASVRDVVLGFVFMGPHMDSAAAARLYATLFHYRRVLPCLWALQGGDGGDASAPEAQLSPAAPPLLPCRLLAFRLASAKLAVTALRVDELEENAREVKKELQTVRTQVREELQTMRTEVREDMREIKGLLARRNPCTIF